MATPVDNAVSLTGDRYADGLIQGGAWQTGSARQITYSFSINDTPGNQPAWSAAQREAVVNVLAAWSAVANVSFVEYDSGTLFTQSKADVAVTLTGNDLQTGVGAIAFGLFPSPAFVDAIVPEVGYTRAEYPRPEGDVFFDNAYAGFQYLSEGGYGFSTILHEIGHALGLKHPYDDGGSGRPTFAELGIAGFDHVRYTVMSVNDDNVPLSSTAFPATPMLLDVLAIQKIYGPNLTYHAGNDTYRVVNELAGRTIWDAAGVDTIDASDLTSGMTIDLRQGHATSNGGLGLWVAYGTTIENAIGTGRGDTIYGNEADNVLDESRSLGASFNQLRGGDGNDTYIVTNAFDAVVEDRDHGVDTVQVTSAFGASSYALGPNIENLTFAGSGNALGTGNDLDNTLTGNDGDNLLAGGAGNDTIVGGRGTDHLVGDAGDDILDGGADGDVMQGGLGNDVYVVTDLAPAMPSTGIVAYGDAGDYITGGQSYNYDQTDGTFSVEALDFSGDGVVDTVSARFLGAGSNFSDLAFSARNVSGTLLPGTYTNALRYPFETSGHPGLNFDLNGRGSNALTGTFTVTHIDIDYSGSTPLLLSFSVTFEQHSEGAVAASYGTFNYNYNSPTVAPESVIEHSNEGIDTVESSITYTLPDNVENLELTGSANIDGTGNALNNVLTGNSGVNTLTGGMGDDTYVTDSLTDIIVENPGEGSDTIAVPFTYTLALSNVENVTLTGSAAVGGTGDTQNNILTGNAAANVLTGLFGSDTLRGAAGADRLNGGDGNDGLYGGGGIDTAFYSGAAAAYAVTKTATGYSISGAEGTDTVNGVEWLKFSDVLVKVESAPTNDLDGDGKSDIVWRHASGAVAVWELDGSTVLSTPLVATVPNSWRINAVADFDGAGQADLLWREDSGTVAMWTMDGGSAVATPIVATIPRDWSIAAAADFDGDYKADILWRHDSGAVAIWKMDGATPVSTPIVASVGRDWEVAGTGDFNRDGKSDIVWRHDTGAVAIWSMDGATVTASPIVASVGRDWSIAEIADFNGDGASDLLWRHDSGPVAVWLMNGATATSTPMLPDPGLEWALAGAEDVQGDGRADILWRHTGGAVAAWLMDGTEVSSSPIIAAVSDDWVIA